MKHCVLLLRLGEWAFNNLGLEVQENVRYLFTRLDLQQFARKIALLRPDASSASVLNNPEMAFALLLKADAAVLTVQAPASLTEALNHLGMMLTHETKDLRFRSYPRESFDGIWWELGNQNYSIDDAHRVLSLFFQSLKAKEGILALSFLKDSFTPPFSWKPLGLQALLRQSGFMHEQTFETENSFLYLCRRL